MIASLVPGWATATTPGTRHPALTAPPTLPWHPSAPRHLPRHFPTSPPYYPDLVPVSVSLSRSLPWVRQSSSVLLSLPLPFQAFTFVVPLSPALFRVPPPLPRLVPPSPALLSLPLALRRFPLSYLASSRLSLTPSQPVFVLDTSIVLA